MNGDGESTISAKGATSVGVASATAAVSVMGVQLLAARTLSPAENADFLVFWSLLFSMFTILGGVQNEVTRAVRAQEIAVSQGASDARLPRVLPIGLLVSLTLATLIATTCPLWGDMVLPVDNQGTLIAIILIAVILYGGQSAMTGALSGYRAWSTFSALIGLEALTRLAATTVVAAFVATILGFELATAIAAFTWLALLWATKAGRSAAKARADRPLKPFLAGVGYSMLASASSSILVVGFIVMLQLTTDSSQLRSSAPLLLAIGITRAPLMMPLNAYQGVAIAHFLANRDRGGAALRPIALVVLGIGAFGALAAALVGPWLMQLLYGPEYGHLPPWVLGGLTLTAAAMAMLTLTGTVTLAIGNHRQYSAGWLTATAVSIAVLLLPLGIEIRTITSLFLGPTIGVLIHLRSITKSTTASTPPQTGDGDLPR